MAFLLSGREMGRSSIMGNGLHLLCPRSFGRESGRNLVSLTVLSLNLTDGGRASPCSGFACWPAKPGGSHRPLAHGPGSHSLRNTDPVAKIPDGAQGNTRKMVFLAQQSQDVCITYVGCFCLSPSGSPLGIIMQFLNLVSLRKVSIFLTSHLSVGNRVCTRLCGLPEAPGLTAPSLQSGALNAGLLTSW